MPTCMAPTLVRTTGYTYDADGVYVATVTDPAGHTTREWRHPGYGFLVERDDPNQLAAVWTYDTFGRLVGHTALSGQTIAMTYADSEDPAVVGGTDVSVIPDGTATAQQNLHFDSMGRRTTKTMPIDASKKKPMTKANINEAAYASKVSGSGHKPAK